MCRRKIVNPLTRRNFLSGLIIFFLLLPRIYFVNGQSASLKEMMDTAKIEEQFNYIYEKASRYEEYKVIREYWLIQYRQSLNDSIRKFRENITDNNRLISEKSLEISSLNDQLSEVKHERDLAVKEKNSLNFIGIPMDKTLYNLIMWILVAALIFVLVLVYLMYKRSNIITREIQSQISDLQIEYDEFRNNARIKMEKVKRDHLNEIIKLKSGQ